MAVDSRRFVILEHQWNGVHWDFLVEDGPTLRTWAIDEPLVVGKDLPARELPPHRRIYLDYEGSVSGDRGTVRRWASGVCEVLEWGKDRTRLKVESDLLVGLVEFRAVQEDGRRRCWVRLGKLS